LLEFEPVTVELCEAAVFNYLVLNNGHADRKSIDSALVNAGQSLTSGSVSSISKDIGAGIGAILGVEIAGAIMAPVIGSLLGSLVGLACRPARRHRLRRLRWPGSRRAAGLHRA
jgi:hypothetical protein